MLWKKLSEQAYQAGWRPMVKRTFQLPSGVKTDFDIVAGGDSACVLALTPDEQVILVKQFRPGPEKELNEMVGGKVDAHETPEQAVTRELLEEAGYVGELRSIGSCWVTAYNTSRCYQFIATNCMKVAEPTPDEFESIEVVVYSRQTFLDILRSGELTDSATGYKAAEILGWLSAKNPRIDFIDR